MAEKHTERITQNYLIKLLNIKEYNTTGNKRLFKKYIPDGWLQNDNNLLIIENKPNEKQFSEGVEQLIKYCKIVKQNKDNEKYNIFCILSIGMTEEEHKIYYFKYNEEKENLKKQKETQIKEIFANSTSSGLLQTVHNSIVNNFQTQDSKDLHDLLIIIIISILEPTFKKYYELKEDMIDEEFLDKLIELTEKKLNDSNNNYKRVEEYIKNSSFINSFKICKTIYNEYNKNPKFVNLLFQQFKKYNTYEGGNNEIWTPKDVARIMFNVAQKYIKKKDNITILDPCIGLNSLIYPFIESYGGDNITVKGCDISDRLSLIGKLDLIIHGVSEKSYIYNDNFITSERDLSADICVCNPPYTKNITNGYECLDFVIKSLEYSKYSVFIFPKNRLIKNKKLNEKLLKNCKIIEIIELGGHVFKNVGTGDIIICVFARLTEKNKDISTKYYNLKEFSEEYKSIPHKSENILSNKGKQIINNYDNGNITCIEYEPTANNMFPNKNYEIEKIKSNLIFDVNKTISNIYSLTTLGEDIKLDIINKLNLNINSISQAKTIKDLLKYTNDDYINTYYIKFKLSERFNIVNKTNNYKYSTQGDNTGDIPLFACKKLDNGIAKYVDKEEYEGNVIIVVHHRDATCGYSFHYNGKLAWNPSCYVIEPKEEFKNIDLDYVAKYLTLTIAPNHLESEHFNKDYLMQFEIEYPNEQEQQNE